MVRGGNASYHIEVKVFFYIHQHDMMQCLLFGTLQFRTLRGQESTLLAEIGMTQFYHFFRPLVAYYKFYIQHCFICRHLDFAVTGYMLELNLTVLWKT